MRNSGSSSPGQSFSNPLREMRALAIRGDERRLNLEVLLTVNLIRLSPIWAVDSGATHGFCNDISIIQKNTKGSHDYPLWG